MKALIGIEDVGVNRRVLHRFIGVIYSHMPIHNAAIQLTGGDSRPLTAKGDFPMGVHFPTGRWGCMMILIGLTGIPFAGNWTYLGRAVAKRRYLEVIAK